MPRLNVDMDDELWTAAWQKTKAVPGRSMKDVVTELLREWLAGVPPNAGIPTSPRTQEVHRLEQKGDGEGTPVAVPSVSAAELKQLGNKLDEILIEVRKVGAGGKIDRIERQVQELFEEAINRRAKATRVQKKAARSGGGHRSGA